MPTVHHRPVLYKNNDRSRCMKITRVTVTPIAFRDPPLLNASGIHEHYALRSIIEIESDNGYIGLGESYGDAPALAIQQQLQSQLIGLDPFNLNHLRAIVQATVAAHRPARVAGAELAPGSHRSEEHTSELQSLMRISYAVFCLKKKITSHQHHSNNDNTQHIC